MLQQHTEHHALTLTAVPGFDGIHLGQGIDQKEGLQAGIGLQKVGKPLQVGRLQHLVDDDQPRYTMPSAQGGLVHRGEADAPGTGRDLARVQLG